MYQYNTTIDRVIDGDTVDVWIDLGFNLWIFERVVLDGIDAPESRTPDAREKVFGERATARVQELLPVGGKFMARAASYDAHGKLCRAKMDFHLPDGQMLCQVLVDERLAVRYHGQHKNDIRAAHEANWAALEKENINGDQESRR